MKRQRPAPSSADPHREMSDLGPGRRVRVGLGSKFTGPVALALAVGLSLMGWLTWSSAGRTLEAELDRAGALVARTVAAAGPHAWSADGGERLRRLVGESGALDVWLLDASGKSALKASKGEIRYRDSGPGYQLRGPVTVQVQRGHYGAPPIPARFFSVPFGGAGAGDQGTAVVVYSAADLDQGLSAFKSRLLTGGIIGLLLGIGGAFLAAKVVTRPLAQLLRDMKAVAGGNLEHRTRARSDDEIGVIAQTFDAMTRNLAAAESMRVSLADREHQVGLAQEVQARLFPKSLPTIEGVAFEARNQLSGELSADLFDALPLPDGRVGVLVMTASGRGVPAAIVLSMARTLYRALAPTAAGCLDTLTQINQRLAPDLRRGMYVSALYAILDPRTGEGELASAGHRVPALQFVAGSKALRRLQADGIAIGLDEGPVFERSLTVRPFRLDAGDRLILASEGAFHLSDEEGEPLGEEALMRIVLGACRRGQGLDQVLATLAQHRRPDDTADVTMVAATRA